MTDQASATIDTGYELGPDQLRVWLGNYEVRLENQWAALLSAKKSRAVDLDLVRLGGDWDPLAARLDLRAGVFGFEVAVTGRFGGSRGERRVRQAAADAREVIDRLTK